MQEEREGISKQKAKHRGKTGDSDKSEVEMCKEVGRRLNL